MSIRLVNLLRATAILVIWIFLALVVVRPVAAQTDATTPQVGTETTQPQDINDVATRLAPLLVGAALIERTLEFLFNWAERALMDASHALNKISARLTGLVQVDLRQAWTNMDQMTGALLARKSAEGGAGANDPTSANPADWPLATLEQRLDDAQKQLALAQQTLEKAIESPIYVARKKIIASVLSIVLGIVLAVACNLRLFEPLGVSVASWFEGPFDVLDKILAGILMGLGTDWVHQVIGLLIQGKGFLGRAGGSGGEQYDLQAVQDLAAQAVQEQLGTQTSQLRDELLRDLLKEIRRPTTPPH
jgi:hypothetical protein